MAASNVPVSRAAESMRESRVNVQMSARCIFAHARKNENIFSGLSRTDRQAGGTTAGHAHADTNDSGNFV